MCKLEKKSVLLQSQRERMCTETKYFVWYAQILTFRSNTDRHCCYLGFRGDGNSESKPISALNLDTARNEWDSKRAWNTTPLHRLPHSYHFWCEWPHANGSPLNMESGCSRQGQSSGVTAGLKSWSHLLCTVWPWAHCHPSNPQGFPLSMRMPPPLHKVIRIYTAWVHIA